MMTQEEFNQWCVNQSLSNQARIEIEKIRNACPSRSVGSRRQNVSGRYPSRKMGVTIQFESHKVELPFIYQLEHSGDVLEYYDQPPPFKIQYSSASGRNLGVIITPDFFVIRSHSAGWVECKTERELEKLAQKSPHRYQLDDNNKWQSPPGLDYAQQFGFNFQLWSSAKINWTLYDTTEHPALHGQSPHEVFTMGINQFGSRNGRLIPYDDNFRILTLPTTKKGKALVQPGKGIKIDNKYYWHQTFRDPQVERTLINVRYDPFNAGIAYAYIQGLWVECISEYYPLFRGRSEKEIELATAQLKKQMQNHRSSYWSINN
ncbi:TnsA endonuclease N-terminal domain-containing protein [Brunnivagina elsteri]|uniref:TnsA endonuclease N-terminal domain-containing protein n=1 Tax=Brunnivagina elsteri CCALA 953 TaxID=987040 RepID=A0A2A2TM74_9CYAN|nr:TnsA endonuclease N-terminal domain-containing protein [Calothrix elsteri]PAX59524.1 hypothetical protein CK510_06605 [Calothrix elsteri CCALA 953]